MAPTSADEYIRITEMIVWTMAVVFLIGPGWLLAVRLFPDERLCWQITVGGGIGAQASRPRPGIPRSGGAKRSRRG